MLSEGRWKGTLCRQLEEGVLQCECPVDPWGPCPPVFILHLAAVCSTVLITRVAKDALEKAIEEHEGGASEEMGAQMPEAEIEMSDASCGSPRRSASPQPLFHTKLSPHESRQQMALALEYNAKDSSKGVLVRIDGTSLSSPKIEKCG